jgi:hypothetical protein
MELDIGRESDPLPLRAFERWGGLILTLLLASFGIALAFPLSILLALGRRSQLPVLRAACVGYIELIRRARSAGNRARSPPAAPATRPRRASDLRFGQALETPPDLGQRQMFGLQPADETQSREVSSPYLLPGPVWPTAGRSPCPR